MTDHDPFGGNCQHSAWVKNARVFLSNDDDTYYQQAFQDRTELQNFVNHLWEVADKAWPQESDQANSIMFYASDKNEIAKFTEDGFYYKGEFIEDAGEVHRLLKKVLDELSDVTDWRQLCLELLDAASEMTILNDDSDAHFELVANQIRHLASQGKASDLKINDHL